MSIKATDTRSLGRRISIQNPNPSPTPVGIGNPRTRNKIEMLVQC